MHIEESIKPDFKDVLIQPKPSILDLRSFGGGADFTMLGSMLAKGARRAHDLRLYDAASQYDFESS